jgi:hypothetical protein
MKSYLVYIITFLMFSSSVLYFLVAILGESLEGGEVHGLQVVQGQEDETVESEHNESEEEHDEATESAEQHEELKAQEQTREEHDEGEAVEEHDGATENKRQTLEFPLLIGAGVGYAAVGVWMILDKRNSKIPYIIAIVGSLILLGLYFSSRTIGIYNLGTEPFGIFDSTVAAIQMAIVAISSFIIYRKRTKGITVDK